jgi:formylglycine-generating enzyme required for sulfatase activity
VLEEQRAVTLTHGFEIQQKEVTQESWSSVGLPNPSGKMKDGTGDGSDPQAPVGNVTWFEAAAFANLLSEQHRPPLPPCYTLTGCTGTLGTGMKCTGAKLQKATVYECTGYRMATDAEWEYAARAGTRTAYYSGDVAPNATTGDCAPDPNLLKIAWYCANAAGGTHAVAQLTPNAWGLYDMSGNAAEWVTDVSTGRPPSRAVDPGGEIGTAIARVFRGGLFNSFATLCRSANHSAGSWDGRGPGLGLRLVRTMP